MHESDNTDPGTLHGRLALMARALFGGTLMGLANLVPGISGGTLLLASGIYPRFIGAIAELTRLRVRLISVLVLGSVVAAAGLAILLFAGEVKTLVLDHRWVMYSLFIGLTLGGVPVLWRMINRPCRSVGVAATLAFVAMAVLAIVQADGSGGVDRGGWLFLLLAGTVGAAAMILPGVSGGYLLLLLGVYVPILAGIDALKQALLSADHATVLALTLSLVLPVGLGVVLGMAGVSNLLRWLLQHYERATLGALLGLLLGAVVGLWPFRHGVPPTPGDTLKGQQVVQAADGSLILAGTGRSIQPKDWPIQSYPPSLLQVLAALGLVLVGFAATQLVDRYGSRR